MLEYRYDVPFKFTGKIDNLTFKLEPEQKAEAKPSVASGRCQPGHQRERSSENGDDK